MADGEIFNLRVRTMVGEALNPQTVYPSLSCLESYASTANLGKLFSKGFFFYSFDSPLNQTVILVRQEDVGSMGHHNLYAMGSHQC